MNINPNPHVQIQQFLLTGSVHLCTSLFVWIERRFLSVRQASGRVSSDGAEANIVKMLGGGCESIGMLDWQTCVTLQPVCLMSSNPYTSADLSTYLCITHMWVWAHWSQTQFGIGWAMPEDGCPKPPPQISRHRETLWLPVKTLGLSWSLFNKAWMPSALSKNCPVVKHFRTAFA